MSTLIINGNGAKVQIATSKPVNVSVLTRNGFKNLNLTNDTKVQYRNAA